MPSPSFTEFATIRNGKDITRGFVEFLGNFIPTQDTLLLEKSGGLIDLYEKVLQDDRVKSCYQQRFSGLTSKEIEVLPGGEKRIDKQAAEHIQKQLEKINWDDITEKMSYGVHYGYSIAECIYGREDDKVVLTDIRVRNRRRFHFGYDMEPKLKTFTNPLGEDLPSQKFWHFCAGADNHDEPYGLGLGHWLYWLTWFKRNDLKWWVTFLENFADPSTIGHYPIGATQEQKRTLQGAVQNIGKTKWATLPEGMLVELLEASRSGTADYQGMHDSLNTAISTLILSQSMTSESGSSEAQATVHKDVGDTVIEADDALINSSFNASVVTWLTNWNFPGAAIPRVRRKLEPPDDLKALADRDAVIVGLGFPLNPDYVLKTYGEGFAAIEGVAETTSLNAGELTAFIQMVTTAQSAGWSPDLVQTSLQIAFPHVPSELLDKLAKSIKASPPADPNSGDSEDQDGQFAAPRKKNCTKGLSCGGSCISRDKMCIRSLDPETRSAVKALKDMIKKNVSPGAIAALKSIKDSQSQPSSKPKPKEPTAEEIIDDFEKRKHSQTFESALAITKDGKLAFEKDGTKSEVVFNDGEVSGMANGILTHNHPNDGNSFSPRDINLACVVKLKEIRAITKSFLFKMEAPREGWASANKSEKLIKSIRKELHKRFDIEFGKKYPNPTQADYKEYNENINKTYWHEVMTEYGNRTGAKYSRTAHNYSQN